VPTLRRLIAIAATTAVAVLVLAAPAFAYNDGRGLYGATDDKVVTNAGFILIGAIPLFILFASLLQWRLEKRKDAKKKAKKARARSADWQHGW
jgi:hypothetical protein